MRHGPKYEIGAVVMSRNPATSKMEENVRQKLLDAGLKLHKGRSAIQCGLELDRDNYPVLTPDILIKSAKVAVEIDSGYTHADELEKDRLRNQLLADIGWVVVRLRLGGLTALGPHDVTTDSTAPTFAAIAALVEAIGDAVAGRSGTVRHVAKIARPVTTKEPSRLGSISPHKYTENAFHISWVDEAKTVQRMVIMDSGNYLAVSEGQGAPRFVYWLGLAEVPRSNWRPLLTEIFARMDDFDSVSRFPWGDDLFIGDQADRVNVYDSYNAGGAVWAATANLVGVDAVTATAFTSNGEELATLHPGAVDAGWQLNGLQVKTGIFGPYQRFRLVRHGDRSRRWDDA